MLSLVERLVRIFVLPLYNLATERNYMSLNSLIIFGFKTIPDKLFHLPWVNQTQLLKEDYFPFFCRNPSSIFTKTSSRRLTRFNLNGVLADLQEIPSRIAISGWVFPWVKLDSYWAESIRETGSKQLVKILLTKGQ